jgi:beta-N-acetylhexosaminidase
MQATGKHFPGHGGIFEDSHISEPVDTRSYEQLFDLDLKPFTELKDNLGAIMTAHITFPDIDSVCVSYSNIWIKEMLRERLAFQGIVFSDDLSMKGAGDYSMGEKAVKSIEAGCDMVLVCNDYDGTMGVLDAFEKNNIDNSGKIRALQNSADIDWSELMNKDRAKDIKNLIREIGRA